MVDIKSSEITPEQVYLSRRRFMKGVGALVAGSLVLAACGGQDPTPAVLSTAKPSAAPGLAPTAAPATAPAPHGGQRHRRRVGGAVTEFDAATNYCNYYEFTTRKEGVAAWPRTFGPHPGRWRSAAWSTSPAPLTWTTCPSFEQRGAHLPHALRRSLVDGHPLDRLSPGQLLKEVEPTSEAKYVRFETLYDPEQMPGQGQSLLRLALRRRAAAGRGDARPDHLSTGLYGKPLLPQNGAPVRLVVPWKYGFKSIKSIVKIDLVAEMPASLWMAAAPNEYGFYANVNPEVSPPTLVAGHRTPHRREAAGKRRCSSTAMRRRWRTSTSGWT